VPCRNLSILLITDSLHLPCVPILRPASAPPGPFSGAGPSAGGERFRRWADLAAVALLAVFAWQALSASVQWSHTSDELAHITAGYAYDHFGDYRLQPENGILPQRVHGLAPLALDAKFPENEFLWRHSQVWQLGWSFFYEAGNPLGRLLLLARAGSTVFGLGLGLFLYLVARRWYGPAGGLVTLGLFCFCPNFLFHSALATSDVAGTLFLTLAAWACWWQLERRTHITLVVAGLVSGCALTAKFSGLLVAPIFALLLGADAALRGPPGARGRRLAGNIALIAGNAAIAVAVIWLLYGFRFQAANTALPPVTEFTWPWAPGLHFAGWKGALIEQALAWHLLPEAYLRGLDYVLASEVARPAFLAGQYSTGGWRMFFPVLFLVKTPVALLLATLVIPILAAIRRGNRDAWRTRLLRWLPLAVTALVTWAAALNSTLNIGHRHILAVYPVLFVAAGSLALLPGRWWLLPLGLCGLQVAESRVIRPHYGAYFNFIGGGPDRAYRLVVDSSLDWGQDLPALSSWLQANRRPDEKLYLSYFGNAWPPHYGVRPTIFLPAINLVTPPLQPYELEPGLYCISATSLAEVYSAFSGPWQAAWEQALRNDAVSFEQLARLRFSRLCKYLQSRTPDANAGHSILIYRLDAAELDAALHGPVRGW
jgi:hypothetical protein